MSIDLRFPNITATTEEGQLKQMQSYMHQLVQQLNWAFTQVNGGAAVTLMSAGAGSNGSSGADGGADAVVRFNDLKSLIIKSADIINAYYEVISQRLSSEFVAISDFGTFTEQATQDIEANSTYISQHFTDMQQIVTDIENLEHSLIDVNARIKSGLLYYGEDGAPVYGLEIGQRTEIDGVEVFHKYARFTAEKLSFYDGNGIEVAYISGQKLFISHVEVTGTYTIGGFVDTALADGSVVTRYVSTGGR